MKKFDILEFLQGRPLSWSALSSFEWSPEAWHSRYILNQTEEPTEELKFGKMIDERLQADPTFMPHVERFPILQHKMEANLGKIPLIGFADGFRREPPALKDDKTGAKIWDRARADETGQLTFYALLLWLTEKIKPESVDFSIWWMPTVKGGDFKISLIDEKDVKVFHTKRTMRQILEFGVRIQATTRAMELYVNSRA